MNIRTLRHFFLCPGGRRVRVVLGEKKLPWKEDRILPWCEEPVSFLQISSDLTVLQDEYYVVSGRQVICEYLDEYYTEFQLMGRDLETRAEVRRIIAFFDECFYLDVTVPWVREKFLNRFGPKRRGPVSSLLSRVYASLQRYMSDLMWYTENRRWLAGDYMTLADIAVAAHLSVLEYKGDVNWSLHEPVKDWYVRIKSRPSFQVLLQDSFSCFESAPEYQELDF